MSDDVMVKNLKAVYLLILIGFSLFFENTMKAQSIMSVNSRSEGNLRIPLSHNASSLLSGAYSSTNGNGWEYSLGWFRPFGIKELEEQYLAIRYVKDQSALYGSLWQSGDQLYQETAIQLGLQADVKPFSIGLKTHHQLARIQGFSNTTFWRLQAFFGFNLQENWLYYSLVDWIPTTSSIFDNRFNRQSLNFAVGMHYKFRNEFMLGLEINQNSYRGLDCRFAQKLEIIDGNLSLSTGYDLIRSMPTIGLTARVSKLSIQVHYSFHPILSSSSGGVIHYQPLSIAKNR